MLKLQGGSSPFSGAADVERSPAAGVASRCSEGRDSESKRAVTRVLARPVRSRLYAGSGEQPEGPERWGGGTCTRQRPNRQDKQTWKQNGGASHAFLWRSLPSLGDVWRQTPVAGRKQPPGASTQARLFQRVNSPIAHHTTLGCR
jgi:hypothetical protein